MYFKFYSVDVISSLGNIQYLVQMLQCTCIVPELDNIWSHICIAVKFLDNHMKFITFFFFNFYLSDPCNAWLPCDPTEAVLLHKEELDGKLPSDTVGCANAVAGDCCRMLEDMVIASIICSACTIVLNLSTVFGCT